MFSLKHILLYTVYKIRTHARALFGTCDAFSPVLHVVTLASVHATSSTLHTGILHIVLLVHPLHFFSFETMTVNYVFWGFFGLYHLITDIFKNILNELKES